MINFARGRQYLRILYYTWTILLCHLTRKTFLLTKRCFWVNIILSILFLSIPLYFPLTFFWGIWRCLLCLQCVKTQIEKSITTQKRQAENCLLFMPFISIIIIQIKKAAHERAAIITKTTRMLQIMLSLLPEVWLPPPFVKPWVFSIPLLLPTIQQKQKKKMVKRKFIVNIK